jgi:hypothetical protein
MRLTAMAASLVINLARTATRNAEPHVTKCSRSLTSAAGVARSPQCLRHRAPGGAPAEMPHAVAAVVSRGGRPDLAGDALARVRAPTLFIVGSRDTEVLELDVVGDLAAHWFTMYLHRDAGAAHSSKRLKNHRLASSAAAKYAASSPAIRASTAAGSGTKAK